jgi:hypothetical protein
MIFGKTGLQGLPTRMTLFLWAFSRQVTKSQGATGVPLLTTWDSVVSSGRAPIPGNISGRSRPRNNTQCSCSAVGRPLGQRWILEEGLRVGVCFITAGPITKLFTWGGEESGGHYLTSCNKHCEHACQQCVSVHYLLRVPSGLECRVSLLAPFAG